MASRAAPTAHGILRVAEREGLLAERVMEHRLRGDDLEAADRARVRDIVHGVLRHRGLIDHLLGRHSRIKLDDLERTVLLALRIGVYRILHQRGAPTWVAVKESVDLVPGRKSQKSRGFVNAVLRALCRSIEGPLEDLPDVPEDPRDLPLAGGGGVRFSEPAIPDPSKDLPGFLSVAYSHPRWIVDRWLAEHGQDAAITALRSGCGKAPFSIRTQRLRIRRDDLLDRLRGRGFDAERGDLPEAIRIVGGRSLLSTPEFRAGLFYVQDETPMRVPSLMDLRPGLRVLDLCAAPGGKSTGIAEEMGNRGEVLACDVSAAKIERIEENCRRLGLGIVTTALLDPAEDLLPIGGTFDRILVDAPCSNSGVFRRRPEARWRIGPETLAELGAIQQRLLAMAAPLLAPDGLLLYSTCSLEPEENREVTGAFLSGRTGLRLLGDEVVLPRPEGPDGGYIARIGRTGA